MHTYLGTMPGPGIPLFILPLNYLVVKALLVVGGRLDWGAYFVGVFYLFQQYKGKIQPGYAASYLG
jgi:hypothetical protein